MSSLFDSGFFFFQAEDGIRDLVRSRGLGDVYKRQNSHAMLYQIYEAQRSLMEPFADFAQAASKLYSNPCLLYTSDAADERSSVDLGGRRIIKKKTQQNSGGRRYQNIKTQHKTTDEKQR